MYALVERLPFWKALISSPDPFVINTLRFYLKSEYTEYVRSRGGRAERYQVEFDLYEDENETAIVVQMGTITLIKHKLEMMGIPIYSNFSLLSDNFGLDVPELVFDKEVLIKEDGTKLEFTPIQELVFDTLPIHRWGGFQVPTGAGKTELMIALIKNFINFGFKDGIGIMTSKNNLVTDFLERAEEYGLDFYDNFDEKSLVNVFNPKGLLNSQYIKKMEVLTKLDQIKLLFIDEGHNLNGGPYQEMFNFLPNLEYVYVFSGTLTAAVAGELVSQKMQAKDNLKEYDGLYLSTIQYMGDLKVHTLPKDLGRECIYYGLQYEDPNGYSGEEDGSMNLQKATERLESLTLIDVMAKTIAHFLREDPSIRMFIPVRFREVGEFLLTSLGIQGVNAILWDSGGMRPEEITCQNDIRAAIDSGTHKVLITTSLGFEGMNITGLNAIMMYYYSSFTYTLQPSGRSSRKGDPFIFINVKCTNNRLSKSQANKRWDSLAKSYITNKPQIIKFTDIDK